MPRTKPQDPGLGPGVKGRLAKLDIQRDAMGKFLPKPKPVPVDAKAVEEVIDRRAATIALGKSWRPTREEWASLAANCLSMYQVGHDIPGIASILGLPDYTVRRALAHAMAEGITPRDREHARFWAVTMLEGIMQSAFEKNDFDAARKAVMGMMQTLGLVSTGGNVSVGVQVNQKSEDEVGEAIRAWIARESGDQVLDVSSDTCDGELLPGS